MKNLAQTMHDPRQLHFHPHVDYQTKRYEDLEWGSDELKEHKAVFRLIDAVYTRYATHSLLKPAHQPKHKHTGFSVTANVPMNGVSKLIATYRDGDGTVDPTVFDLVVNHIALSSRNVQTLIHVLVHAAQVDAGVLAVGSRNAGFHLRHHFQPIDIEASILQQRLIRDIKKSNPEILTALKSLGWDVSTTLVADQVAESVGWLMYAYSGFKRVPTCKAADVHKGVHDKWIREHADELVALGTMAEMKLYGYITVTGKPVNGQSVSVP